MASTTSSKTRSRRTAPARTEPAAAVAMLTVSGDPAEALKGLVLPEGVRVALVSSDPEAVKRVKLKGKRRFGPTRLLYAGAVRKASRKSDPSAQDAFRPDARSQALLEGVRIMREDLRSAGGSYDLDAVRTLMRGISRQAVDKRVREGSLLAVPGPSNQRRFPTLQFNRDGTVVDGLRRVLQALPTKNPWTVLNFLAHPDERLDGRKPIDALRAGDVDLAVESARRMGHQGA